MSIGSFLSMRLNVLLSNELKCQWSLGKKTAEVLFVESQYFCSIVRRALSKAGFFFFFLSKILLCKHSIY